MASFRGTPQEFHKFIGPRIRNAIQTRTKQHKMILKRCQKCGSEGELDAAHIRGKERKSMALAALGADEQTPVVDIADLSEAEAAILQAHEPLAKHFLFLCKPCHRAYDSE